MNLSDNPFGAEGHVDTIEKLLEKSVNTIVNLPKKLNIIADLRKSTDDTFLEMLKKSDAVLEFPKKQVDTIVELHKNPYDTVVELPKKPDCTGGTKAEREIQEHLNRLKLKVEDGSVRCIMERRGRDISGKYIYLCYPCAAMYRGEHILEVLKKTLTVCDPSSFPPTKEELLQQIKRTTYISNVWCNANLLFPTDKKPEDYGWTIIDNKYVFYWFEGPESPSFEAIRGQNYSDNCNDSNQESENDEDEESSAYEESDNEETDDNDFD